MEKLNKFIRNNFLFILIILATIFAFVKKATIWQLSSQPNTVISK
jgi:hypothetical protein